MFPQPLVSVIIPFYNRVDLLINTLISVNEQTYGNLEVILVDDCSREIYTTTFFKDYIPNFPCRYHRLGSNYGPGYARRMGRSLAEGAYVAYLDSDDLWENSFISETVQALESDSSLAMAFTNVLIKRGEKERLRLKIPSGGYNFFDLIFGSGLYWATGAALWRSSVSKEAYWQAFRDHEDYVHDILSLSSNPKIYFISEALCVVNKNSETGIRRSNKEMLKSLSFLASHKNLYGTMSRNGLKLSFYDFMNRRLSKRKFRLRDKLYSVGLLYFGFKWQHNLRGFFKDALKFLIRT